MISFSDFITEFFGREVIFIIISCVQRVQRILMNIGRFDFKLFYRLSG